MKQEQTAAVEPTGLTPKVKLGEKLGFLGFSTGSNVVYQFKSLYYLFFLTNVLGIPVATAGIIYTIGTVWDAINDPLLGFWSVNHKFRSGERIRPFALWFAIPWAVSVILLFTDFGLPRNLTVALSVVIYLVFELFNTFVAIPYNSMGSLATNRDEDRRSINVFRNLGGCVGSGIGAVACLPLLRLFGGLDEAGNLKAVGGARGFFFVAVVMGAVCVAGCLIHYFTSKERVQPIAENEEKLSVMTAAGMLLRNRSWVMNTLYIICYGVINLLLMSCLAYYATYVMGSTASATPLQGAYLAASVVTSFFVTVIDRAIGRKKTMILGAVIFILGKIWFLVNAFSLGAIYVNAITVGIAVTITFVMFNTNRNNIVDVIEWKEGRRLDSLVSTADNLASKLATAGATLLITFTLARAGFDAALSAQPDSAISAINLMLGWVPTLVAAVMLLVVCFLNIERDTKQMAAEKQAAR